MCVCAYVCVSVSFINIYFYTYCNGPDEVRTRGLLLVCLTT